MVFAPTNLMHESCRAGKSRTRQTSWSVAVSTSSKSTERPSAPRFSTHEIFPRRRSAWLSTTRLGTPRRS